MYFSELTFHVGRFALKSITEFQDRPESKEKGKSRAEKKGEEEAIDVAEKREEIEENKARDLTERQKKREKEARDAADIGLALLIMRESSTHRHLFITKDHFGPVACKVLRALYPDREIVAIQNQDDLEEELAQVKWYERVGN